MLVSSSVSSVGLNSMFVWMFGSDLIFSASVLAWSYIISYYLLWKYVNVSGGRSKM